DRECDVETIALADLVGAALFDSDLRKSVQRAPRRLQRTVIDIDRESFGRAIGRRPIGISPHPATDIDEALAAPVAGLKHRRPAPELLLVFGTQLRVLVPFIAKTLRRSG